MRGLIYPEFSGKILANSFKARRFSSYLKIRLMISFISLLAFRI